MKLLSTAVACRAGAGPDRRGPPARTSTVFVRCSPLSLTPGPAGPATRRGIGSRADTAQYPAPEFITTALKTRPGLARPRDGDAIAHTHTTRSRSTNDGPFWEAMPMWPCHGCRYHAMPCHSSTRLSRRRRAHGMMLRDKADSQPAASQPVCACYVCMHACIHTV